MCLCLIYFFLCALNILQLDILKGLSILNLIHSKFNYPHIKRSGLTRVCLFQSIWVYNKQGLSVHTIVQFVKNKYVNKNISFYCYLCFLSDTKVLEASISP